MKKLLIAALCAALAACSAQPAANQSAAEPSQTAAAAPSDPNTVHLMLSLPKDAVPAALAADSGATEESVGTMPVSAEDLAAVTSYLSGKAHIEKLGQGCTKHRVCDCENIDGRRVCACYPEIVCPD